MARRHARAASALALMLLVALSAAGSDKSSKKQKGSKWNKKGFVWCFVQVGPAFISNVVWFRQSRPSTR